MLMKFSKIDEYNARNIDEKSFIKSNTGIAYFYITYEYRLLRALLVKDIFLDIPLHSQVRNDALEIICG